MSSMLEKVLPIVIVAGVGIFLIMQIKPPPDVVIHEFEVNGV